MSSPPNVPCQCLQLNNPFTKNLIVFRKKWITQK